MLLSLLLNLHPIDDTYLESLYSRQNPNSLTKQLYFYSQYPNCKEGQKAKQRILELLKLESIDPLMPLNLDVELFEQLLKAIFKTSEMPISLNNDSIAFIEKMCQNHQNRKLAGCHFLTKQQLIDANAQDIDVGRGMLLLAFGDDKDSLAKVKSYEAVLDFMAICIKAQLNDQATSEDIVHAMNHFIFYELGYRFPAHSEHEEKIDVYTVLPSVLDKRQGVCLGVSLLYYSLAQRLGLNLDIYTPPGHIFLSLHKDLNIETTARGIHLPLERYLTLHVKQLHKRNQKELLGMVLFNQASVFLKKQDYHGAAKLYEEALRYIPEDPQILELLGSCYFMCKELKKANLTFVKLKACMTHDRLSSNYVLEDFFKGLITPDGLKAVFQDVESNMQSLLEKAHELEKIHQKSPKFRSGLFQLGVTYLQMRQNVKAFKAFEKLFPDAKDDPILAYYLTYLSLKLYDRPKTYFYKQALEKIMIKNNYRPKACCELFDEIQDTWPSPLNQ